MVAYELGVTDYFGIKFGTWPGSLPLANMNASVAFHTAVLVFAALGILIALAGIAFWWASRKMNRLT
jgi:hypothetical protein